MQSNQEGSVEETAVSKNQEQGGGVPLKVREVAVGGTSSVVFEDYTLAVPYKTELVISQLQVTGIDSTKPEQQINLKGNLEKRAPLELDGSLAPFGEELSMKMKLKLKNYPLSSLSAYTVQSVGTALASGQLNLKTKVELAGGNSDLLLAQWKLLTDKLTPVPGNEDI